MNLSDSVLSLLSAALAAAGRAVSSVWAALRIRFGSSSASSGRNVEVLWRELASDFESSDRADGFVLDLEVASSLAAIDALWSALPAQVLSYERVSGSRGPDGRGVWVLRLLPLVEHADGMLRPGDPADEVLLTVASPSHWDRPPQAGDVLCGHKNTSGVNTLLFRSHTAPSTVVVSSDINRF